MTAPPRYPASAIPEPVRDGLRHMAAIFQTNQAIRSILADVARVEVDAAIAWVHAMSCEEITPE